MKKCPFLILLFFIATCFETKAGVTLTASIEPGNSSVSLRWNMTNYYGTTAYVLLKSADGVNWQIAAANPVFRNYTSSTILAYNDNFKNEQKLFYRVRIYDTDDKTVALSNTAGVANPKAIADDERPQPITMPAKRPASRELVALSDSSLRIEGLGTGRGLCSYRPHSTTALRCPSDSFSQLLRL